VSRTLIFFTKKEHVQKIIIDKPIGALGSIKDTEQGWLFKAELLDVSFRDRAGDMLFKLDKDSTMIKELIRRIVEGHIDTERIGSGSAGAGIAPEPVRTVAPAAPPPVQATAPPPVQQVERLAPREIRCPGCGAVYDKPLLKGMTSDECPYCSTTIRF